jgi:hypothetical protein
MDETRIMFQAAHPNHNPASTTDPDKGKETDHVPPEEASSWMNHQSIMSTRDQLIWAWDDDVIADQMDLAMDDRDDDDPTKTTGGYADTSKYNTSWGYQYRTLVHRSLKNSRSAIFTPINFVKSAALGMVSGALWFQMEYTEKNVFDISSFFFFTMT